jgi:PAS domain S-box-containing protein
VVTAKEKESVRRKLEITAKKLAVTAKEKESVRRRLVVTANKLKGSYETLENKVFERTKSLEMARAKEEAILLSIGDGLLVTDEKGAIILFNRTAEKLLGKKSKEIIGRNFADVMPLEDDKGEVIFLEQHPVDIALTTSLTISTKATYYYVRKDTTKFPVASIVSPVLLNKKVIGAIKVFRDVTYERNIDKAKTEFVSLASHQLRTPLTSIGWYTEMLIKGSNAFSESQKKYLEEVYQGNKRMVELVNTLLDVSRIELGTFIAEPKPIDIVALAQAVIAEQKQNIEERELIITQKFSKVSQLFLADPKLLHIVFHNLITNAVKYTPIGGKIEFTISFDAKKTILIKVSDTGYGIPKDQQKQIFTKLFRADNARDKDTSGTGLGLYIVKSIVENSGGKIWFNSPAHHSRVDTNQMENVEENPGTTFYVALTLDKVKTKN